MGEQRIRIGNQTAFSAQTPIEPFEYAVKDGFDAFEWFPDKKEAGAGWDEKDLDIGTRQLIKRTAQAYDIRLSVHPPWSVNPLHPRDFHRLLESLEFARDVGASRLNIHLYIEEGLTNYLEALTPLLWKLDEAAISLSIENTPLTGPEDFNALFARLENLQKIEGVGMCLDLGHANLCASTRNDYLRFIDRLDPRVPIVHIHAHENFGESDDHLPLFTGPSAKDPAGIHGFVDRMKRRSFYGCIILEQWPQPPRLLDQARDRLIRMFNHHIEEPTPSTGATWRENSARRNFLL
jgi:sugar phosphate isomerase/epimerase